MKYLYQIIGALLVALAAFQIGRISAKKDCERRIDEVVAIYSAEEADAVTSFDKVVLAPDSAVLLSPTGEKIPLRVLASPRNVTARYSATGCPLCIDVLLEELRKFTTTHPEWHINLLIDNMPPRDLYVFSKEFDSSFSLYSADALSVDLGSDISPVVFRVDKDGGVYRHFTCSSDAPELTERYVATIDL